MSVAFVANVGSRDVHIAEHPNLPKDSRILGERILDNWETFKPDLRLPILVKALDWVLRYHDDITRIVLFATSQPPRSRYHHTDTRPFAEVITRYLREERGTHIADMIEIVTIDGNPADYDAMMHFYADALSDLTDYERVYLQVSGGTPAMSFMLLWQGVETLGQVAQPLYVIQEHKSPLSLNIGHTLIVNALVDDLLDNVRVYQYNAARSLLNKNADLLQRRLPHYDALYKLVDHAAHRMNFRFDLAEKALMGADRSVHSPHRESLLELMDDITGRNDTWMLREEIYATEIAATNGAYRQVIAHTFAVLEELLYQWALKLGVGVLPNGDWDRDWLASEPALEAYLNQKNVRLDRGANTHALDLTLAFYAKSDPALKAARKPISHLMNALRGVRNTVTHSHGGVSQADIEQAAGMPLDALLADLRGFYAALTGSPPTGNAYTQINALVKSLVEADA